MLYPAELWAHLDFNFSEPLQRENTFPEGRPPCPHPTFKAMGGHSIQFKKYVNRIHPFAYLEVS
jgi:hypothetical protein